MSEILTWEQRLERMAPMFRRPGTQGELMTKCECMEKEIAELRAAVEANRTPISAPTTAIKDSLTTGMGGERKSIADDPEFHRLAHLMMTAFERLDSYSGKQFVKFIDTWASRSAGDAVPAGFKLVPIEPTERMREAAASFGHPDAGYPYPNGYSKQRGEEAVESYRHMIGAAPAPGNTERLTETQKGEAR